MVDQLTSSQIAEFQRVLNECDGFSSEAERNRRLSELADPTVRELMQAAFEEPVSARNLPPCFRVDGYELTERLGGGGFGEVWLARRVGDDGKEVAVKVIRSEHLRGEAAGEFFQLFRDEIDRHKTLAHDGIVKLISAGSVLLPGCVQAAPYLVMELWDGLSLPDACRGRTIEEKIQCMIQICEAVQHAHRHGLMHLDLKPENILVADTEGKLWPKVLDFGLARRFRAERPFDSARFGAGTLPYKAPEQIDAALGGEDFRTDVHALGVILFQVLTDHLPYPVEEGKGVEYEKFILNGPRLRLDVFDKSLDSKLQKICARAMAVEQAKRYDSPASLAKALEGWLRSHAAKSRNRVLLAAAFVVCVAIVFVLTRPKPESGIQWRPVPIMVNGREKKLTSEWADICFSGDEGWLVGGHENSVEGEYVGNGLILHTSNEGRLWEEIAPSNFATDTGTLPCFEDKTWKGIGPIRSVSVIKEIRTDGNWVHKGWVAGITGVYFNSNAGSLHSPWTRITPPPDDPECYSFFEGLWGRNNYQEAFAFGWQGIAYREGVGQWEVQLKTHLYSVCSFICADWDTKDFWAVAGNRREPAPPRGELIADRGALYHHFGSGTNWDLVPLQGITLSPGQHLTDIVAVPRHLYEFLVTGDFGLILRGSRQGTDVVWKQLRSNTDEYLQSASYDLLNNVWVVGSNGTILRSADDGESWVEYPCFDEHGRRIHEPFHRIRFWGTQGWIVGNNCVLKCELP